MEDNFKNRFGVFLFVFVILFLGIGGYFFTQNVINDEKVKENEEKNKILDLKIDKDKAYIYYTDDEVISDEAEISYRNAIINIKGEENLTDTLKKENEIYKNNIKYIPDDFNKELVKYNRNNIYSLIFREYKNYEYENYVSLVLNDYNYSCFDDITFNKTRSYIFDTKTGNLLSEDDLMSKFYINMDMVKEKIREYLTNKQSTDEGVEVIKIDDTINSLDNYAFYVNNYGHLCITYLVKTTQVDYNEDMEVL